MNARIQRYEDFWPYYLGEHKSSISRKLHFVGTSGFLAAVGASAALNPVGFSAAALAFAAIWKDGAKKERDRVPGGHIAAMAAIPTLASPILFPAGMTFAYGCAWIGHFGFEKNRPATFQYPLWSLASDFKMWGHMATGKLWSGDNPAEQLGFSGQVARGT